MKKNRTKELGKNFDTLKTKRGALIYKYKLKKSSKGYIAYLKEEWEPKKNGKYKTALSKVFEFPMCATIKEQRKWMEKVNKVYMKVTCEVDEDKKTWTYKNIPYRWSDKRKDEIAEQGFKIRWAFIEYRGLSLEDLNKKLLKTEEGEGLLNRSKLEKIWHILSKRFNRSKEALIKVVYPIY